MNFTELGHLLIKSYRIVQTIRVIKIIFKHKSKKKNLITIKLSPIQILFPFTRLVLELKL